MTLEQEKSGQIQLELDERRTSWELQHLKLEVLELHIRGARIHVTSHLCCSSCACSTLADSICAQVDHLTMAKRELEERIADLKIEAEAQERFKQVRVSRPRALSGGGTTRPQSSLTRHESLESSVTSPLPWGSSSHHDPFNETESEFLESSPRELELESVVEMMRQQLEEKDDQIDEMRHDVEYYRYECMCLSCMGKE
jgi:hypothetical protein